MVFIFQTKMSTFTIAETNHIIASDAIPHDLHRYSADIQSLVSQYWNEFYEISVKMLFYDIISQNNI